MLGMRNVSDFSINFSDITFRIYRFGYFRICYDTSSNILHDLVSFLLYVFQMQNVIIRKQIEAVLFLLNNNVHVYCVLYYVIVDRSQGFFVVLSLNILYTGCPRKSGYGRMYPYLKIYFMYILVNMISYSHVFFKVVATNPRPID